MSWFGSSKPDDVASPIEGVDSVVSGLKNIYAQKILPLEKMYDFSRFHSSSMEAGDFDSKPTVMLMGQYSVGKTSFIEYLLERKFPGMHIGPEPTTDRFMSIMWGNEERVIPGNALAVQADKPYRGLQRFGNGLLNKFAGAQLPCELLENFTFIDTPGVLSGEKQRIGRAYDFSEVCSWFAERADLILLLFDAHKLDISDEFKDAIESLKGNEDKVRVVLNKADMVSNQQLMRVYGALMWSLGKVLGTPEVTRVYIGSFWSKPYQNTEQAALFDAEREDLFRELMSLPKNSAIRKINELVKRARAVRVHAHIISHLKSEMPAFMGKKAKQEELIANLGHVFKKVQQQYQLPPGDFPPLKKFREQLKLCSFDQFRKLDQRAIDSMEAVLAKELPELMRMFPGETSSGASAPGLSNTSNGGWAVSREREARYTALFEEQGPVDGHLTGGQAKKPLMATGLAVEVLGKVWELSDIDKDGRLSVHEFCVAMFLVEESANGRPVPDELPLALIPPSLREEAPETSNPFL